MEATCLHCRSTNFPLHETVLSSRVSSSKIKSFVLKSSCLRNGSLQTNLNFKLKPRRLCIQATADGGRDFQEKFQAKAEKFSKDVSDAFSGALNDVKSKAQKFEKDYDISGKSKKAFRDAKYKVEELTDDLRRQADRLNREYKVSEKVKDIADSASEQFRSRDEQWGLSRKWRVFSADFKSNWPKYQRNINAFLATPVGKLFTAFVFSWLLLSGILFQILFWSLWLFPLIPPLLRKFTQDKLIQGTCPSCGFAFVGSKTRVLSCRRCSGVVWQPKQDFSKNDAPIIDIDLD